MINKILENCFLIKDYPDLVKLVEMDLSLFENPELKDIVENIRKIIGNVDKLPELRHNILIYNAVIGFATNYTNICCKIKNNTEQIIKIENKIKGINANQRTQKEFIINNLTHVQKLQHKVFGDKIIQIRNSTILKDYNNTSLVLKTEKSIKTTISDKLEIIKINLRSLFISKFIYGADLNLNLGKLTDSIENHILLGLNDRVVNLDILKNMQKCDKHNE